MKIKVYVDKGNIRKSLDAADIEELVDKLKININEYILVVNDELISGNIKLKSGDDVKFLSVVSGG